MTNNQIIFNQRINLMEAGVIGTTGRVLRCMYTDDDGTETIKEIPEPEELHTFADWKTRGYMVQKGQKARARFTIWNYSKKPRKTKVTEEERKTAAQGEKVDIDSGYYYMKEACFFAASQVAPLESVPEMITKAAEKLLPALWAGPQLPAVIPA